MSRQKDIEKISTKNFHYTEFFYSSTAERLGIDNKTDNFAILRNLRYTALQIQKVRDLLEHPIIITSGYRCEELNETVGGSSGSYHLIGQAVDFICPKFGTPNEIIKAIQESNIIVDQCIAEYTYDADWVHISFLKQPRNSFLIYQNDKYIKL